MGDLRLFDLQRSGLHAISADIVAGETLCIHGPSGAGKTLLLRAIADLDPNQGQVYLGDIERAAMPAHEWRRRVMYLPPEAHWWADHVAPHAGQWPDELLQPLGFDRSVLDWEVTRLSSGERQRLSLIRLLARGPEALLLDEPTANLDPENTLAAERLIAGYQADRKAPVVWVSHDPEQRTRVASRQRRIVRGELQ
jgi:ABC-type iron transport system FetAB ATPase subunit